MPPDRFAALADRLAIEDLLVLYCTCVDTLDIDRLVTEVFAEDASDNHGMGIWSGRDGLRAAFTELLGRFGGTLHQVANFDIRLDGDTATARSYVTAWHWLQRSGPRTPNGPPADFVAIGAYHDRLRREPAGWRITRRTMCPVGYSVNGVGALPDFMVPRRR
jgi:hypothetical protein